MPYLSLPGASIHRFGRSNYSVRGWKASRLLLTAPSVQSLEIVYDELAKVSDACGLESLAQCLTIQSEDDAASFLKQLTPIWYCTGLRDLAIHDYARV